MITADQVLCHLFGDYILQSDWMANEKTKKSVAALAHALSYALPFLFLRPSLPALAVIVGSHFLIDRWRMARYVVYAENWLCPFWQTECSQGTGYRAERLHVKPWAECKATGYHESRPAWMTVWLLIIADNALHILCNGMALYFL